jgi:mannan polymerase complexes MNN9 subunit
LNQISHLYRSVITIEKDFGNSDVSFEDRHMVSDQIRRRERLAKSRNYLFQVGLKDEEWVLWIDADVKQIPSDAINRLLSYNKDIIVPNCKRKEDGEIKHYDLNSW